MSSANLLLSHQFQDDLSCLSKDHHCTCGCQEDKLALQRFFRFELGNCEMTKQHQTDGASTTALTQSTLSEHRSKFRPFNNDDNSDEAPSIAYTASTESESFSPSENDDISFAYGNPTFSNDDDDGRSSFTNSSTTPEIGFSPPGRMSLLLSHSQLYSRRPLNQPTSYVICILDEVKQEGKMRFKLQVVGSPTSMSLADEEVLESIATLVDTEPNLTLTIHLAWSDTSVETTADEILQLLADMIADLHYFTGDTDQDNVEYGDFKGVAD